MTGTLPSAAPSPFVGGGRPLDDAERKRLDELEIRYTHQSDTLHALHEVVWAQERRIQALETELQKLSAHLRGDAEEGAGDPIPTERPPHY